MARKKTDKKTVGKARGRTGSPEAPWKKTVPKKAPRKKVVKKKAPRKKSVPKKPMGRPTVCTEEGALGVLERIMEGDCLEEACTPEHLPSKRTWLRWVAGDERLQRRYISACQIRALMRAEECVRIADDADELSQNGVSKARLRVSTRQWEIQRLQNKVYGRDGVVLPPIADSGAMVTDPDVLERLKALRGEVVK